MKGNGFWAEEARAIEAITDSMLGTAGDEHSQAPALGRIYLPHTLSPSLHPPIPGCQAHHPLSCPRFGDGG